MKITKNLLVVLMAATFALAGCGKSEKPPVLDSRVDFAKFQAAFPSPGLQIQSSLDKLKLLTSQGRYEPALYELENLSRLPNLTAEQKQAISDLTDQVKKAVAAAPAKPGQ